MKFSVIQLEILLCMQEQGFLDHWIILRKRDLLGIIPVLLEQEVFKFVDSNFEVV